LISIIFKDGIKINTRLYISGAGLAEKTFVKHCQKHLRKNYTPTAYLLYYEVTNLLYYGVTNLLY